MDALWDLVPNVEESGIMLVVIVACWIFFTKVLNLDQGPVLAVICLVPLLYVISNKTKAVSEETNDTIFEKLQALGAPEGLHLEPDLVLLFDKLQAVAGARGSDPEEVNRNVSDAARHAADVLKIREYMLSLDHVEYPRNVYQNASDKARDCINAVHSTIYAIDSDPESKVVTDILEAVQGILDTVLLDIQKRANTQFAKKPVSNRSQFVETWNVQPSSSQDTTFDFYT